MQYRKESDSMGTIIVESNRYWGAQTQRSLENFKIGRITMHPIFIQALARVKKACAMANHQLGLLEKDIMEAVVGAADEIIDGNWEDQFPLKIFQTGSGTQTNMNMNEVISNRANEILGYPLGSKKPVHPNDIVNKSQSSNDIIPTAMHVAAAVYAQDHLFPNVEELIRAIREKSQEFASIIKIGRTHLQDATPVTLGQEFSGYVHQLEVSVQQVKTSMDEICALTVGGTAVGTGLNAPEGFDLKVCGILSEMTGLDFRPNVNKFQGLAGHEQIVFFHGALKSLATAYMKIANDIRWLASGPRSGIGEINIPANEPGSSIMPGKVNPTQCEAMTMVAIQVMGNDTAVGFAASQGNFELNVYKPIILHNVMESLELLGDVAESFRIHLVEGIEPNPERINENMKRSLMLVTALNSHIGYDNAAKVAKKAFDEEKTLKEVSLELGFCTAEQFDDWVDPRKMV